MANDNEFSLQEKEILALIAQGMTNKELSARLGIAERTVEYHVSKIIRKIGARTRAQAIAIAVQMGILGLSAKSDT